MLASHSDVAALLRGLPIHVALLTDAAGAILLRAGETGEEVMLALQRMGATFAQTAEQAGKARRGKNMHTTAFYGARRLLSLSLPALQPRPY